MGRFVQNMRIGLVCSAVALMGVFSLQPVHAQGEADQIQSVSADERAQLETIYSTARQRNEQFQDVPVAGTVLSNQVLERYSITDLEDIASATPQLIITQGTSGGGPGLFLRGIGSGSGSAGFDPAVGIVIDGLFYSRSRFVTQGFFDMETVEILKGPQALFFGKNNSAGLIVIQTADPGDAFEARLRLGYEVEAREIVAEGMVSGPINDKVGMRLAVRYSDMSGWLKNTAGPQTGVDPLGFDLPGRGTSREPSEEEFLGRFTMKFTPSDDFVAVLKVNGARNTDSNRLIGTQLVKCFGPGGLPQLINGVPDPFEDCKQDFNVSLGGYPADLIAAEPPEFGDGTLFSKYESITTSLEMDYDFGDLTLSSVSGYIYYDARYFSNADVSAASQIPFYENNSYESFSQELRLTSSFDGPLNFLLGALYQNADLKVRNAAMIAPLGPDVATGRFFTWDKSSRTKSDTWSVYGELQYDITSEIELAAGARYTKEDKSFLFTPDYIHGVFLFLGVFTDTIIPGTFDDDDISPQVTLTWRPQDNLTLYAAYKEGFKSGGFDNSHIPGPGFSSDDLAFNSEQASGYEIGAKARFLDNTLSTNFVFYDYRIKGLQIQQLDTVRILFFIDNIGKAATTGFEFDFTWLANENFTLRGGAAFNDGRIKNFMPQCFTGQTQEQGCTEVINPGTGLPTAQDQAGDRLRIAPKWNVNLGFSYEAQIGNGMTGMLTFDGRYSSSYFVGSAPDQVQDDFVILDASLRLLGVDDLWEVAVIGRNLTNKAVIVGGFERALTGGGTGTLEAAGLAQRGDFAGIVQRGREIMFQVTFNFN